MFAGSNCWLHQLVRLVCCLADDGLTSATPGPRVQGGAPSSYSKDRLALTHKGKSRTLLHFLLNLDELNDTVLHLLNSLELGKTHAALVGNVVHAALSLGVLAAGAANLEAVLASDFLKLVAVGGQLGELDVDGGTHGGAKVGGAESEEAQAVVVGEGNALFNLVDSVDKAAVYLAQVTAHLHGDDAEMVLFVTPDQEGLVVVVVDATASGPVTASIGGLQEAITLLEEEVVIDQLLLHLLGHASKGVVGALELTLEVGQSRGDLGFHLLVLSLSEARVEGVAFHGTSASHASGDHELSLGVHVDELFDVAEVLGRVLVSLLETLVVVLNDGVEQWGEEGVGLGVRSVHTNTRVQVLNTCRNKRH